MPSPTPTAFACTALLVTAAAARADQTWTGRIADSACGARHESGGEMGDAMNDRDCTIACVRGGSKYVLVVESKVYKIANQTNADLPAHAGETVRVTSALSDDTLTIAKVEATK